MLVRRRMRCLQVPKFVTSGGNEGGLYVFRKFHSDAAVRRKKDGPSPYAATLQGTSRRRGIPPVL